MNTEIELKALRIKWNLASNAKGDMRDVQVIREFLHDVDKVLCIMEQDRECHNCHSLRYVTRNV